MEKWSGWQRGVGQSSKNQLPRGREEGTRGMRGPLTRQQLGISGGEHSNVKRVNCVGRLSAGFLGPPHLLKKIGQKVLCASLL